MTLSIVDIDASPVQATAQRLAQGYAAHFGQADALLTYKESEAQVMLRLSPEVALVGVVDAIGVDPSGVRFFREDKSASPKSAKTWKRHWVLSPQALTYALITGTKLALVRRAFKTIPPTYDHEWFSFKERELRWWKSEVMDIAAEISAYRDLANSPTWKSAHGVSWPTNIEHGCFAYGENYPCAFYADGCSVQDFASVPKLMTPYERHESPWKSFAEQPGTVVLDGGRIKTWMRCRELYRRTYEVGGVVGPPSDDLLIGKLFHELIGKQTRELIANKGERNV